MTSLSDRPNIRIEIRNTLTESMEVDGDEKPVNSDFEDGEISDKNDVASEETLLKQKEITNRAWGNTDGGFTTGINIFDKEEQKKLLERASRFGLKLGEVNNFTDEQLQQLHISLGITADNEKNIRFEAVHMRGTDEMSTKDIFEYFGKYGPACVEWINDESCNVVWNDNVSAARALHFISKQVKGMPVEGPCDPFIKEGNSGDEVEKESENSGRSILLRNREVELQKDEAEETKTDDSTVNLSDITAPIPPGYWRLGIEHPKSKFILLRFAFKSDKKPLKAERFSEYYKKHGNPNFGGMKGIISESRRKKIKGIFDRNKEMKNNNENNSKNPWGDLAESWNQDEQFSERIFIVEEKPVEVTTSEKSDVLKRLGMKRNFEDAENQEDIKKKTKVPRMRMYADEEEEKVKRKKQLSAVKTYNAIQNKNETSNNMQDLRSVIGDTSKKIVQPQPLLAEHDDVDLGTRLKNRRQRKEQSVMTKEKSKHQKRESSHNHVRSNPLYKNKLHSDRSERRRRSPSIEDNQKPKSKVAVVIKRQKRPTVASTVWSRINVNKERLKTASERLRYKKHFSSSSSSDSSGSSSNSSSGNSSSSESSSDSDDESKLKNKKQLLEKLINRPGFSNSGQAESTSNAKSPLRIEINNDHFKEE